MMFWLSTLIFVFFVPNRVLLNDEVSTPPIPPFRRAAFPQNMTEFFSDPELQELNAILQNKSTLLLRVDKLLDKELYSKNAHKARLVPIVKEFKKLRTQIRETREKIRLRQEWLREIGTAEEVDEEEADPE